MLAAVVREKEATAGGIQVKPKALLAPTMSWIRQHVAGNRYRGSP